MLDQDYIGINDGFFIFSISGLTMTINR